MAELVDWLHHESITRAATNTATGYIPSVKKTNADRIRAMSDEELAVFLEEVADGCDSCPVLKECTYTDGEISEEQVRLKWLKQECE